MKTFQFLRPLAFALLAAMTGLTACNKDEKDATPEYGFIKIGGQEIKLNMATESASGSYILSNQGPSADRVVAVTVQLPSKPTGTQSFDLKGTTYVSYTTIKSGTATPTVYFGKDGEALNAKLQDGKVKLTLANLTEVDIDHKPVTASTRTLSGELSGK